MKPEGKQNKSNLETTPATMTCKEAAKRHLGMTAPYFARLCIRGSWLLKNYGSMEEVPQAEQCRALFAQKIGKYWIIPVEELDRYFVLDNTEARSQSYKRKPLWPVSRSPSISKGKDTRARDKTGKFCKTQ